MPCDAPKDKKDRDCPGVGQEPADQRCPICNLRTSLKARRGSILNLLQEQPGTKGGDVQKAWQGRVDDIIIAIFHAFFDDDEPCRYSLAIAGSGAREEACAYSDLDCFLLVEKKQAKGNWFEKQSRLIKEYLTDAEKMKGLRFCTIMSPLGAEGDPSGPPLIRTPEEMAEILDLPEERANAHVKNGLLESRHLMGDEALHTAYRKEVTAYLNKWKVNLKSVRPTLENRKKMGLERIREAVENEEFELPEPWPTELLKKPLLNPGYFQIKSHFYRPIQFMIEGLAWYYNRAESVNSLKQLEDLTPDHVSKVVANNFKAVWDPLVQERFINQLTGEGEYDYIIAGEEQKDAMTAALDEMFKKKKANPSDKKWRTLVNMLKAARVDKKGFDKLQLATSNLAFLKKLGKKFHEEKTKATLLKRHNPFLEGK